MPGMNASRPWLVLLMAFGTFGAVASLCGAAGAQAAAGAQDAPATPPVVAAPPVPVSPPAAATPKLSPAPAVPAVTPPTIAPPAPTQSVAAGGILGRTVLGPDGQLIGRVVDVLVDAGSNPRAAVIDFGGFMGVGARRIAVNWSDLTFPPVSPAGNTGDIKLDLSADQIMNAPVYSDQTRPAAVVQPPPAASPLVKPDAAPDH